MNTKNDFSLSFPSTQSFNQLFWEFLSGKKFQIHKAEVANCIVTIRISVYFIDTDELVDYMNENAFTSEKKLGQAVIKIYEPPVRVKGKPGRKKKLVTGNEIKFA